MNTGFGVEQNYAEAITWYRRATQQGEAAAAFNLGGMYTHGLGVAQDDVEAAKWYRKAAD
jgi:TPR repeat protein